MSYASVFSVALSGITGHMVEVAAQTAMTTPGFVLVGVPDTAIADTRDRVRAGILASGFTWPKGKVTVTLTPASLPKVGPGFDLAVGVAVLAAGGHVDARVAASRVFVGELGLDGRVLPVRGVLPMVAAAVAAGHRDVVVPAGNAAEAGLVPGARVTGVASLGDAVAALTGTPPVVDTTPWHLTRYEQTVTDLGDVPASEVARRGVEVAAAGGHHLLLTGADDGFTARLGSTLPGLLPDLDEQEAIEAAMVASVAGLLDPRGELRRPPFEAPHHTATPAAVVGGGVGVGRPGAVSRAHHGVLLLGDAPEFTPRVLETLRQPLEHGEIVLHRSGGIQRLPARVQLVLTARPCPCQASRHQRECVCTPLARRRYMARLSGPLLDRIDIQINTDADGAGTTVGESSAVVAARVAQARAAAAERLAGTPWRTNAAVPGAWLRERLRGVWAVLAPLDRALDAGELSLRGADRVLRIAWTLADLAGRATPSGDDVTQALTLRTGHTS